MENNDMLFQIVKAQVDAYDAYCLLETGSPNDEFDLETRMIVERINKGMTVTDIAEIMAQVMTDQFNEKFYVEEFISYAEEIEKFLNS
ncbi:MAG: hypothetical protein ACI35S_02785 [Anaeroplasma sp.]